MQLPWEALQWHAQKVSKEASKIFLHSCSPHQILCMFGRLFSFLVLNLAKTGWKIVTLCQTCVNFSDMLSQHRVRQKSRMVRAFFLDSVLPWSGNAFAEQQLQRGGYNAIYAYFQPESSWALFYSIMAMANQSNSVRERENSYKNGPVIAWPVPQFQALMCIDSLLSHRFITSHILRSLQLQH